MTIKDIIIDRWYKLCSFSKISVTMRYHKKYIIANVLVEYLLQGNEEKYFTSIFYEQDPTIEEIEADVKKLYSIIKA